MSICIYIYMNMYIYIYHYFQYHCGPEKRVIRSKLPVLRGSNSRPNRAIGDPMDGHIRESTVKTVPVVRCQNEEIQYDWLRK